MLDNLVVPVVLAIAVYLLLPPPETNFLGTALRTTSARFYSVLQLCCSRGTAAWPRRISSSSVS